jgi:hypothetical protein
MTLQGQFGVYDFEEPLALFFLDYAAILMMLILLGAVMGYGLRKIRR